LIENIIANNHRKTENYSTEKLNPNANALTIDYNSNISSNYSSIKSPDKNERKIIPSLDRKSSEKKNGKNYRRIFYK
jgi:hypothetical protein